MVHLDVIRYDKHAQEAVVQIHISVDTGYLQFSAPNLNKIVLTAFWHPVAFPSKDGDVCLFAFLTSEIIREERIQAPVKTNFGYYSYRLYAEVLDAQNRCVRLGDVSIILDIPIPKDIQNGDIVSFHTQRLDLEYQN